MSEINDLTKVFTGTDVIVNMLKDALEQNGIGSMIKNSFQTGNLSGFVGGTPSAIDLYILTTDLENAQLIIDDFTQLYDEENNHEDLSE